ncbi:MAG: hypothetical protein WC799_10215 [Desulfobacteraceae bacterium]
MCKIATVPTLKVTCCTVKNANPPPTIRADKPLPDTAISARGCFDLNCVLCFLTGNSPVFQGQAISSNTIQCIPIRLSISLPGKPSSHIPTSSQEANIKSLRFFNRSPCPDMIPSA